MVPLRLQLITNKARRTKNRSAMPQVGLMYGAIMLTCLDDEDCDHKEGEANQKRKRNASKVEAVLAPKHQCSYTQEEDGRGYEGQNGRHKP